MPQHLKQWLQDQRTNQNTGLEEVQASPEKACSPVSGHSQGLKECS